MKRSFNAIRFQIPAESDERDDGHECQDTANIPAEKTV